MRFKSFLIALVLLLWPAFAVSQTTVDDGHSLLLTSFPDGAEVFIDGVDQNQVTPVELRKIIPGKHTISLSVVGWNTATTTINVLDIDGSGHPRDTHISLALLPTLTVGSTGPAGPQGASGVSPILTLGTVNVGIPSANLTGTPTNPILNLVLPQGIPGANGAPGYTPRKGIDYFDGAAGANGAVGPQGLPGISTVGTQGPTGPTGNSGPAGASAFAGSWDPAATYSLGAEVLRPVDVNGANGSVGPYFNISGNNTLDPAKIPNPDWVYCCGTPTFEQDPAAPSVIHGIANAVLNALVLASVPNNQWDCFPLSSTQPLAATNSCPGGLGFGVGNPFDTGTYTTMTVVVTPAATQPIEFIMTGSSYGGGPGVCVVQIGQTTCTSNFAPTLLSVGGSMQFWSTGKAVSVPLITWSIQ